MSKYLQQIGWVAICLLILLVSAVLWVQTESNRDDIERSLATLQNAEATPDLDTAAIEAIATQIAESEERALAYLGIFESISFWVSLFGIVIVFLGLVAAVIGVSNFNEMRDKLETTRKELEAKQSELSRNVSSEIAKLQGFEAQNQARLDDFNDARKSVSQLAEDFRKDTSSQLDKILQTYQNNQLAFTLVSLAERDLRSHNIKSAITTLRHALELDNDNPLAHYYLGINLTSLEELEESRQHLKKALDVDDNFHHARAALGFTVRRIGELKEGKERDKYFQEAESLMREALAKDPDLVDFEGESWYGALGGLYRRQNRLNDAIYCYRNAEKVTPSSSYPLGNLARLALQTASGDIELLYNKVGRLARREISLDSRNYWAYSDLLASQLILGDKKVSETVENLLDAIPKEVTDVLPRILETVTDIKAAKSAKNDVQALELIDIVLKRLHEAIDSNA